jgi:hypothetical protein
VGAATQAAPPGFGVPTITGIQGYGYEPGLVVDPLNGDIYTTVPDTASTGTSVITVPSSDVTEPGAGPTMYSVTGSTQALTGNAENPPNTGFLGLGGNPFNLVDVAPAFNR